LRLRSFFLISFFCLSFFHTFAAQSPTGTISGIVTDPTGATVAGADVLVVNDATRAQFSGKTNDEGIYVVPNLPPGNYRVQVSKIGFKTIIKPDIVVNVQDALAINFALPLGAVSEIVTIQGGAPLVNTESASVSTVVDRQFVENLPLNGRSFNTLLQLTPGVVIAPSAFNSPGQFSVAGQRSTSNNFSVDGVSANFGIQPGLNIGGGSGLGQAQAFSATGGTSSLVSVEDLQEFRIETSSFSAEFGRQPGGQVLLTTRSGTNDWHGAVFNYFRNTVMDANDWFANGAGLPRAAENHNDFGGIFGGPIHKDKTFFFVSYEGARLRLPSTIDVPVPSDSARTNAPTSLAPFLKAFPMPNGVVSSDGFTAEYTGGFSNSATLNAGSARIDHIFNQRFSIFGRFNEAPSETLTLSSPSELDSTSINTRTGTVGLNMMLTNNLSNSLRGNFSLQEARFVAGFQAMGGAILPDPGLYLGGLQSSGNEFTFQNDDTYFFAVGPIGKNQAKQLNIVDDLAWTKGNHKLRFGADVRELFVDLQPASHNVEYFPGTVGDFLSSGQTELDTTTVRPAKLLAQAFSFYAQDTWNVTPRITLSYGLRWEVSPAPSPRGTTIFSAWENVNNPSAITLAPSGTSLWTTKYHNFAPRFGIAYKIDEAGNFVFRGGVGMFYDLGLGVASLVPSSFPNSASSINFGVAVPTGDVSPYLPALTLTPPYAGQVYAFSPDLELPRSYEWNLSLEKSFAGKQALSLTYVGQAGRDLLRRSALFRPNSNFTSFFYLTKNEAFSNYDALQVQYRRPLSGRLQALLSYTYAHSLDNDSSDFVAGLANTIISAENDYGSSDFDVRHNFSGAITYFIPALKGRSALGYISRDWSVSTLVDLRTGFPLNAHVRLPGTSLAQQFTRPDLVPGQPFWIDDPLVAGGKMLNRAAFAIPSTPRQGTEGRNDIRGFSLSQVDLSLARKFAIGERWNLLFRADAFNALNHPNFTNPSANIQFGSLQLRSTKMLNRGLGGLTPLFQAGGPRSLQISLKLSF
jgi:Carboxypeptidase regulatory-like domain/TonB-dependent Receptor Plug Domain